ncbi:hypothetical protein HDU97_008473 [Phlyctochytrium planicorne]|nr:hypothetical protein HDU97_008473 [Phlyctochytrium planicorne]
MSRYNTPAAVAQAVAAAKLLPVDRSGEVWRIEIVSKDRFTVLSASDSDGLIRTNITIPSTIRPTATLLLDLLLQSCLLPISSQPRRRPRSISLQCTRNPEGMFVPDPRFPSVGNIFLVPLASIAELEELMRHSELTLVRIRVSMRADEEQEEREIRRNGTAATNGRWINSNADDGSWATGDDLPLPLSPPPSVTTFKSAAPSHSSPPFTEPMRYRRQQPGSPLQHSGRVQSRKSSMGSDWWEGSTKTEVSEVTCFRMIMHLILMLPLVHFFAVRLKLLPQPPGKNGIAAGGGGGHVGGRHNGRH